MNNISEKIKEYFTGKKIVITGASGYIAINLFEILKGIECSIHRISRTVLTPACAAHVTDYVADIKQETTCEYIVKNADIVFHLAAQTDLYAAEENPKENFEINVKPLMNIITQATAMNKTPVIILAGTATESGLTEKLPVSEETHDMPITVYDLHKLFAEKYIEYASFKGIIKGVTLRLANVYGPGQCKGIGRGIVNKMLTKALNGEDLNIYGEGDYIRDFVYIDDVSHAFLLAAMNVETLNGRHYNIGSGKGTTLLEAANIIAGKVPVKILKVTPPENLLKIEFRNYIADSSSFEENTGWHAETNFETGIEKTIAYLKNSEKQY